jgi:hypothetical protein
VRRVDRLARGELVRETAWGTRKELGPYSQTRTVSHPMAEAHAREAKEEGLALVRVTRVRRP